jgi:hypothetical protein
MAHLVFGYVFICWMAKVGLWLPVLFILLNLYPKCHPHPLMHNENRQTILEILALEERRIQMQLQLFVRYPEAFRNDKDWLNEQINQGLDELKKIWAIRKLLKN